MTKNHTYTSIPDSGCILLKIEQENHPSTGAASGVISHKLVGDSAIQYSYSLTYLSSHGVL